MELKLLSPIEEEIEFIITIAVDSDNKHMKAWLKQRLDALVKMSKESL